MSARIIIGGDIVPTKRNLLYFEKGDVEQLIGKELCEKLNQADYTVFNLEVPLTDKETPIEKCGPNLVAPTNTIKGLKAINKGFFTLANNHILDQGEQGLVSTMTILKENNIDYSGAGMDIAEARQSFIKNINGIKIGIYCCAEYEFSIATEASAGSNPFDSLESLDHIVQLKQKCDYVIVLYHGGKEHYRYPSPNLQKVCRKLVDKGADIIVCQHSHCIGCEEKWKDGTIVYGQGNFLFDHSESEFWKTGLLIQLDISDNGRIDTTYIPLRKNEFKVQMAEDDLSKQIMREFKERSVEIYDDKFLNRHYEEYAQEMFTSYLSGMQGRRMKGILFRICNKLTGHRLEKLLFKYVYGTEELLRLKNTIECEAHRELFLKGLMNMCNSAENEILFYVCVPVYKVEKYIATCIQSVLKQTYQNFKLVLVDDGSPDQSGMICDKYALQDERIEVIHQRNMGLIAARQAAIGCVREKEERDRCFIVYLDSDDSLKENALQVIKQTIEKTNCDLLFFGMDRVADGKVVYPFDKAHAFIGTITDKRELYNLVLNDAGYNPLCRKAVDFSIYKEVDYSDYYHIRHAEDLLQSLLFYQECQKAVFIEDSLYNYTINPASITQNVNPNNFTVDSTVRKETLRFIYKEGKQNKADIEKYLKYCKKILASTVRTISMFQIPFSDKVNYFNDILKDDYYRMLLNDTDNGELLFKALMGKHYYGIIIISKIQNQFSRVLRRLKKC